MGVVFDLIEKIVDGNPKGYGIENGIAKSLNYGHYIHKAKILILPPKVWA